MGRDNDGEGNGVINDDADDCGKATDTAARK